MNNNRKLTNKDLAYNAIADNWLKFVDTYDTERRIEVLINDFCNDKIEGKKVLDAGCGLGFFSVVISKGKPIEHTACDLAPLLVNNLVQKLPEANAIVVDLLNIENSLPEKYFDLVISSEVIEHTPDPLKAVKNLCDRVGNNGYLAISCPNKRWKWLLHIAQFLKIRKTYIGYENWITASQLVSEIEKSGLTVIKAEGIHLLPWQMVPKSILRIMDIQFRQYSFGLSINHAVLAKRRN